MIQESRVHTYAGPSIHVLNEVSCKLMEVIPVTPCVNGKALPCIHIRPGSLNKAQEQLAAIVQAAYVRGLRDGEEHNQRTLRKCLGIRQDSF
jgi:hypothetical protein